MGSKTKIGWTEATWNPVTGCTKASAGCQNCYAERMATRLAGRGGYPKKGPFRITYHHDKFGEPYRWKQPRMIFVCSMGDLFHQDVPDHYLNQVFQAVADNPRHTFQVLTKRAHRMAEYCNKQEFRLPNNLWLGVSAENQAMLDMRLPQLATIWVKVRFVSIEPMLGPVDLRALHHTRLDWVIVGGETGPGARPLHPDWVRAVRDECVRCRVPFFFKSWGEWTTEFPQGVSLANRQMDFQNGETFYRMGAKWAGRELDGRTWDEFPQHS